MAKSTPNMDLFTFFFLLQVLLIHQPIPGTKGTQ
jgi:hypothetical protein